MIDVERTLQAIADLEATAVFLRKRADLVRRLANGIDPGVGPWPSQAAERSVEATIRFGAAELDTLAMKLRQDLQAYLQVDELHIPEASPGLPL
ncbi:MAG: hypothetical protein ACT4NY_12740 [Pseudonocardiales bacterium]